MNDKDLEDLGEDCTPSIAYWLCESCGHIDKLKPLPMDRESFYKKVELKGSPKCPKCKSESFMPIGF